VPVRQVPRVTKEIAVIQGLPGARALEERLVVQVQLVKRVNLVMQVLEVLQANKELLALLVLLERWARWDQLARKVIQARMVQVVSKEPEVAQDQRDLTEQ
jgi:hypothetical protein